MELLHLSRTWDDHVLCWILGCLVVMVAMVVVHVTDVRVDEAVGLDLGSGFVVKMLLGLVHTFVVAAVALSFGTMVVVMITVFWLLMLFYFFLFYFEGFFWLFHGHN